MAASVIDKIGWGATRDEEGHREYKIKWLVKSAKGDGPSMVFAAAGLPTIGSYWNFGGSDSDCWCHPQMSIAIHQPREGDPNEYWTAEQTFSSKPKSNDDDKPPRCQDSPIGNPLLEPPRISGSFVNARREAVVDRFGTTLQTSARQLFVGPQVEFDFDNPTVHVEMNTATLGLSSFSEMINTVNDTTLWGLPRRFIKLGNVTWERKIYGSCSYYFTRGFDFQVDNSTRNHSGLLIGFDRELPDFGDRCLRGKWVANLDGGKPGFVVLSDADKTYSDTIADMSALEFGMYRCAPPASEVMKVALDGHGRPANTKIYRYSPGAGYQYLETAGPPAFITVEHYDESNFLSLGIPTTL